jgi:sec-independent protein translocase protein TatA
MAFGQTEIIVIVILVVVLFGATAIPKLARSMGRAQGEFVKAKNEFKSEMSAGEKEADSKLIATAKGLDIETDGKSDDELRAAINEKLS